MTALRWRARHVHYSAADYLHAGLTALGWFGDPPVLPLTQPITWLRDQPEQAAGDGPVKPNTVGVSIGDEPDFVVRALGGGLLSVAFPCFVDIYGENRSVALALSSDVKEILAGQRWSVTRYMPLFDYSEDPKALVTSEACEISLIDVGWRGEVAGQTQVWRRAWRVVAFTAEVFFVGDGTE